MTKKVDFCSSVDAAMFIHAIVEAIAARGIPTGYRFTVTDSAYRKASTPWQRLVLRLRMYVEYPIQLAWDVAFTREPTVFIVTTGPFYAPFVAALVAGRQHTIVHLIWDIYPDALIASDSRIKHALVCRVIEWLVQGALDRSHANVFLGRRLLEHAESRFRRVPRSIIIPVGGNARVFADSAPRRATANQPVDVLYCGNLGLMHDTETLLSALQLADVRGTAGLGFTLTFNASGAQYARFRGRVAELGTDARSAVRLEGSLGDAAFATRMKQAQVALVTMKPGTEKVVMPSKTYNALAAGQAILAVCPQDSDLARLVIADECGWVVPPGDPEALLMALREITAQPDLLLRRRENAFRAGQTKYSDAAVAELWIELLNVLEAGHRV